MFEGARRIAKLTAAVATIGTLFFLLTFDPYVSADYVIAHPNGPITRTDISCPFGDGKHYFSAKTSNGKNISINLCLLSKDFGGKSLIPYKIEPDGRVWGAESYASEVSAYEKTLENRFKFSPDDEKYFSDEVSRRYRKSLLEGLAGLCLGLAIFGSFVWAVGWIVRGFMGIPRGSDSRG
jgi:hypothetical protein